MSDTPRTDALLRAQDILARSRDEDKDSAFCREWNELLAHARKLERESAQLLEAARKCLAVLSGEEMSKQALFDAMRAGVDAIEKATNG